MSHSLIILTVGFASSLAVWVYAVHRWDAAPLPCALLTPTVVGTYVLINLHRHVRLNRPAPDAPPYRSLGIANVLTASRGLLLAFLAGFLCFGWPPAGWRWLPGLLYTVATAADFADGLAARLTGRVSLLGEYLDMHLDGLGVLLASLLAIRLGQMPWWYALVGLARYLYLIGEWLLRRQGRQLAPLPPSSTRRAMAGIQMGFLAMVLYPIFAPPAITVIGASLFVPFMLGFIRDFLAVAGYRWAVDAPWLRLSPWQKWVLPLVRWLTGSALIAWCISGGPVANATWAAWLMGVSALLMLGGILPRLTATAVLVSIALYTASAPMELWNTLAAVSSAAVLTWGGGRFGLWAPDEKIFLHHLGELCSPPA